MKLLFVTLLICALLSIGQSSLNCGVGKTHIYSTGSRSSCHPDDQLIPNCVEYNNDDKTKCNECVGGAVATGTAPNISSCDCSATPFMAENQSNDDVCVTEIPNCSHYRADALNKCFSCVKGASPSGSPNEFITCDCTGKPNHVKDNRGLMHCVANLIPNCAKYDFDDDTKCYTCYGGATGDAAAGLIENCTCPEANTFTDGVDNTLNPICAPAEIPNCKYYNKDDVSKCHTCIGGVTGTGDANLFTACPCEAGNVLSVDRYDRPVCIAEAEIITGCKTYNYQNLAKCHECDSGFVAGSGSSPTITRCDCDSDRTAKLDENEDNICVVTATGIIDNCKYYANADNTKCHTCNTGYTATGGSSGLHESCVCDEGKHELLDSNEDNICVTTQITDCKLYNPDNAAKCAECLPGYAETGTTPNISECGCDSASNTVSVDGSGNNVCVVTDQMIDNCIAYNAENLLRCHTCITDADATGYSPNITECACASPKYVGNTETAGEKVCAPAKIDGCDQYNSAATNTCYACGSDYTAVGETSNQHTGCNCTDNTKVSSVDQSGASVCGADIANCESLNSGNKDQCHTCEDPYQGNGSSNDHTTCTCPEGQIAVTDELDGKHCAASIDNCETYSSANQEHCHACVGHYAKADDNLSCTCTNVATDESDAETCVPNVISNCLKYNSEDLTKCHSCIEGVSTSGFLNRSCFCSDSNLKQKQDGTALCVNRVLDHCTNYLSPGACDQCEAPYEKNSDDECTCPEAKAKFDANTNLICLTEVIENCNVYSDATTCEECVFGFQKNADGVCESGVPGGEDPSSGSVVSFAFVLFAFVAVFLA